jgi:hypothetical protein
MGEFLSNYGLWIGLGGIFVAMHTQRHGAPAQAKAGAAQARESRGCH